MEESKKDALIEDYLKEFKEDEISFKDLFVILKGYIDELYQKKYWIILLSILLAGMFLAKAIFTEPVYNARINFMINQEGDNKGAGGVVGLIGSFIGGGSSGEFNIEKILELTRSRTIVQSVIFEKKKIDGKEDFVANHIIKICEYAEDLENSSFELKDFTFSHGNVDSFTTSEGWVLKFLVSKIAGNVDEGISGLLSSTHGEETSILEFSFASPSEELSIIMANEFYEKISEFYVLQATERQVQTHDILVAKVDSLQSLLSAKQYQLLQYEDTYRNVALKKYTGKKIKLQQDVQILILALGKALENREVADFSLRNATPFFREIDRPLSPILPVVPNKIFNILIGAILGLVLGILWFGGRKLYSDLFTSKE